MKEREQRKSVVKIWARISMVNDLKEMLCRKIFWKKFTTDCEK